MIDLKDFITCNRSLLIAPAGHGKTTAIADCILQCPENSCQLILTHTHAGIASLRTKFHNKKIPSNKYKLETITGFAQRYVINYLGASKLPSEDDNSYFNIAEEKCSSLLQSKVVQTIIMASFDGIFVDEYQDCTINQHNMIMNLALNLPLHVLGDPLQGIFSFENSPLVNFDMNLNAFTRFELLDYPWRWDKTNPDLGKCIFKMRQFLVKGDTIHLTNLVVKDLCVINCTQENDKYKHLIRIINQNPNNILIIYPSYHESTKSGYIRLRGGLTDRISLKQRVDFANSFSILDAIDSHEYYSCAKKIDSFINDCQRGRRINRIAKFYDLLKALHINTTGLNKWIDRKNNTLKKRRNEHSSHSQALKESFSQFENAITLSNLRAIIMLVRKLPEIKQYHRCLYDSIHRCFEIAITNDLSMYESMNLFKSHIRHQGRKIEGNYIGTTLLTKGLEFETVILWDAHRFEDAKNFYVAISRACKRLIIMTESTALNYAQ